MALFLQLIFGNNLVGFLTNGTIFAANFWEQFGWFYNQCHYFCSHFFGGDNLVGFITVTIIFGCPKNCNAGTPANLLFTTSTELPDLACFVGCFITVFTGSLFAIVNSLSNC